MKRTIPYMKCKIKAPAFRHGNGRRLSGLCRTVYERHPCLFVGLSGVIAPVLTLAAAGLGMMALLPFYLLAGCI